MESKTPLPVRAIPGEKGFTLIELLIVVSIIGILAGISVSTYSFMKTRGFNAQAKSSLRNAITAEEALASDGAGYVGCSDAADCETTLPGFQATSDVEVEFVVPSSGVFVGTAYHPNGTVTYEFNSSTGQYAEL